MNFTLTARLFSKKRLLHGLLSGAFLSLLLPMQYSLLTADAHGNHLNEPPSTSQRISVEQIQMVRLLQSLQAQMSRLETRLNDIESRMDQRLEDMDHSVTTLKGTIQEVVSVSGIQPEMPADVPEIELSAGEALLEEVAPISLETPASPLSGMASGTAQQTASGGLAGSLLQMNPNISVIGDVVGNYARRSNTPGRNRLDLREVELAFQSSIDPYSRADIFLALGEEGIEVEEGYITLLALPGGLQAKVGKFRNAIGRINRIHGHELPQVDRPDVITQFFGDEGLADTGINVSKILPLPWYSLLEAEVTNGDNSVLFGHGRITKPMMVSHWKNFFNLTDNTNLELGLSGALGSRTPVPDKSRLTGIAGVDLTYRWVPPKIGRQFTWQSEFLTAQLEHPTTGRDQLYGFYSFIESQLSRRIAAGVRVDYTQIPGVETVGDPTSLWAIAPYVNFFQSEFGRLRMEYKHTFQPRDFGNDRLWLQYTATIGAHGAHPF